MVSPNGVFSIFVTLDNDLLVIQMESSSDSDSSDSEYTSSTHYTESMPVIYGITPTYARLEQEALLTR